MEHPSLGGIQCSDTVGTSFGSRTWIEALIRSGPPLSCLPVPPSKLLDSSAFRLATGLFKALRRARSPPRARQQPVWNSRPISTDFRPIILHPTRWLLTCASPTAVQLLTRDSGLGMDASGLTRRI